MLRFINSVLTFLVVLSVAVGGGLAYLFSGLDARGPLEAGKVVAIPRNEATMSIAQRLEREGIISSHYAFLINYWLLGRYADWNGGKPVHIKAGEYEFKANASVRSVIETLSEGRSVTTRITIPEGLTSWQIVERLKGDSALIGEVRELPPEGSLLPETYNVPRGATRTSVIEMMQAAQKRLLDQLWTERQDGLPFKTPAEALIMASIVEKETGRNDERERVAAVFINRLRQTPPMKLQSDPTILYGLFQGKVAWGKPILRSEIQSKTAHNTYEITGLPPTPICNPGKAAIEATLKPAKTRELYFVANGQGGHLFAETLKDHNANVARWRQIEAQRAAAAAGATQPAAQSGTPITPQQINNPTQPAPQQAAPQQTSPAKGAKKQPQPAQQ